MPVRPLSDEQRRVAINLAQQYEVWIEAKRHLAALPYGLRWKGSGGHEYLTEIVDRTGRGHSLGPRSEQTEWLHRAFETRRAEAKERRDRAAVALDETCRIYRTLRLPQIAPDTARILREADIRNMLGTYLFLVGTNAIPAYVLEAGAATEAPAETEDCDFAWIAPAAPPDGTPIWSMLKAVDATYTVNTERRFQARNARAFEVELLAAPSRIAAIRRGDKPYPILLPEQEWLLEGKPVAHVVVARDNSPARIVAPDPRWFALQKLWLADKPERNPLKKPKDRVQGEAMLALIDAAMPHYPLDADFGGGLPPELAPYLERWRAAHPRPAAPPAWSR